MSMLAEVAFAAGLDKIVSPAGPASRRKPSSVTKPQAAHASVRPAPVHIPAALIETAEATAYISRLVSTGHRLSNGERTTILAFAEAWSKSADIRSEFGSFPVFASYMRGHKSGAIKCQMR